MQKPRSRNVRLGVRLLGDGPIRQQGDRGSRRGNNENSFMADPWSDIANAFEPPKADDDTSWAVENSEPLRQGHGLLAPQSGIHNAIKKGDEEDDLLTLLSTPVHSSVGEPQQNYPLCPDENNPFDWVASQLPSPPPAQTEPQQLEGGSNDEGELVWYEGWDQNHGCFYYFNEKTKESRWVKPDGERYVKYNELEGGGRDNEEEDNDDEGDEGDGNEVEEELVEGKGDLSKCFRGESSR